MWNGRETVEVWGNVKRKSVGGCGTMKVMVK